MKYYYYKTSTNYIHPDIATGSAYKGEVNYIIYLHEV